MKKKHIWNIIIVCCLLILLYGYEAVKHETNVGFPGIFSQKEKRTESADTKIQGDHQIPEFSDQPYVVINQNIPDFSEIEIPEKSYERYSDLDELGRCGTAFAYIGKDLMPTKEREPIGKVKPTGWQTEKYDVVDGKYLYNRCHLIGYQLTAENANENNLITGTRYMNVEGMLPFENMVADYIKETGNHVLYRVTPVFEGDNLLVSGVQMEAKSVEDNGEGISFNIYAYNNQPEIKIDYLTGKSQWKPIHQKMENISYILNKNTHKFHKPTCSSVEEIKKKNKEEFSGSREELIHKGYEPCSSCVP